MQYLYQFVFYLLANRALMAGAGENGVAIFNVLQNLSYLVLYLYDGAASPWSAPTPPSATAPAAAPP